MPQLIRILLMSMVFIAASSAASEWEMRLQKDGILVESRLPDGKTYQEFRASVEIDAALPAAIALLNDNSVCTEWLFRCKESRLIEQISRTEKTFYQRTTLPFPAKDRDAVFHASITFEDSGAALVTMNARPDALPETRYVRLHDAYGSYYLEPLSDSRTRVTWQQYVDPAGALPKWLVNAMLTDLPFRSLKNFRELVKDPAYRGVSWILDETGTPIDITSPSPRQR